MSTYSFRFETNENETVHRQYTCWRFCCKRKRIWKEKQNENEVQIRSIVYDDLTVVLLVVFVAWLPVLVVDVLVFLTRLTPDKRLARNDACERALRAAALKTKM